MKSEILREKFLEFFKKKGHVVVPSASLTPENDPTSLFTTAGMQQFKRFYLHPDEASAKSIVTIQSCLRTSDIDEVGDESHLTFFEMLGNFSFNDYFKKEAIADAFYFLTDPKWLSIDKKRVSATFFGGEKEIKEDKESLAELKKIKGLKEIKPQGFAENFWSLGQDGSPGGPTVEFYIDDIEVWNLVFNEYILENGKYVPVKNRGVDTGMGLERLAVILQKAENIYHTDLFSLAHEKLMKFLGRENVRAQRVILDHIRAAVFLLFENVLPSNKEQGYVLRRLIRKAMIQGKKVLARNGFIKEVALAFIYTYKDVFPKLFVKRFQITKELDEEINKFSKTLALGLKEFDRHKENLSGEVAFNLYQTFGFPFELTIDLAKEARIKIDKKEFEKLLKKHQELSRSTSAGMFKGGLVSGGEQETKLHTATHLLLAALKQVVSKDIKQRGSNITKERLRFDFNYPEKLSDKQIKKVADLVNEKISADLPVIMKEMSLEAAKKSGAVGIFDSKYGDCVKIYKIGDFSREICGGPHVTHTGALGSFVIIKEESSSAGIRRIKAILK